MEKSISYPAYRWLVLSTASVAIMTCYMNVLAYAPLLGQIAADLNIDPGRAMNLVSVTYIVTAFTLFFAGYICDRFGIRIALLVGLLLSSVPAVFLPWIGDSFSHLLMARLVQGAAPAFVMVAVGPITGLWFPKNEQGIASGLMMGSLSLGAAIGLLVSPALWKVTGSWRSGMVLLSILGWIGLALTLLMKRRPPGLPIGDSPPIGSDIVSSLTPKKAISSPVTWIGAFVFFLNAWSFHSLYALVPAYLSAPFPMGVGLNPVLAGKLSLALTLVGIFAVLAGGLFLDRVVKGNYRLVIAIGFILTAIFSYLILLPIVHTNPVTLISCLILAGWGIPFISAAIIAFAVNTYPIAIVGQMLGLLGGLGTFGGAAGVYLGGLTVAKTGNFNAAIGMISLSAVMGFATTYFLRGKDRRGLKEIQVEALSGEDAGIGCV